MSNERELFEKYLGEVYLSEAVWCDQKNTYKDSTVHCMWSAWQASAQREGFVLVESDRIQSIYQSCNNALDIDDKDIYKGLALAIIDDMIEAGAVK